MRHCGARIAAGFHGQHLVELDRAGRLPALLVKINLQRARTLCYLVLTDKSAGAFFGKGRGNLR
jgi:hypothetical protein